MRAQRGNNPRSARVDSAARIYTGSYAGLVNAWLASDTPAPLTECAFAFCVYHLQALRIPFDESTAAAYIEEVLFELDQSERQENTGGETYER